MDFATAYFYKGANIPKVKLFESEGTPENPEKDWEKLRKPPKKLLTRLVSCNIIFKSVIVYKCQSKAPERHFSNKQYDMQRRCVRTFTLQRHGITIF